MAKSAYARKYTAVGVMLALAIVVGAVLSGRLYVQRAANNPMSVDAVLTASLVNVAATIAGRVVTIAVADNQRLDAAHHGGDHHHFSLLLYLGAATQVGEQGSVAALIIAFVLNHLLCRRARHHRRDRA